MFTSLSSAALSLSMKRIPSLMLGGRGAVVSSVAARSGTFITGTPFHFSRSINTQKADNQLASQLESELEEELESATQTSATSKWSSYLAATEWKLASKETSGTTLWKLHRTAQDGEKITITATTTDMEDAYAEMEEQGEAEDAEDSDAKPAIPLTVTVTKPNSSGALLLNVTMEDLSFFVDSVSVLPSATSTAQDADNSLVYSPIFEDLADSVKDAFTEYLVARGFDVELAKFVTESLSDKEQAEYVQWLRKIREFVQSK